MQPNNNLNPGTKRIPLSGANGMGKFVLVDAEDYDNLIKYRWFLNKGYAVRIQHYTREDGVRTSKTIYIHRVIMNPPDNMQIDHLNRNKLDNRKSNLRICTASENIKNQNHKMYWFCERENRWKICVNIDGKWTTRSYKTEEEAKKAVKLVKSGVVPSKKVGHRNKFLPKYISRYITKNGPRYYYRYVVDGVVYRKCGFESIKEATKGLIKSQKGEIYG